MITWNGLWLAFKDVIRGLLLIIGGVVVFTLLGLSVVLYPQFCAVFALLSLAALLGLVMRLGHS